MNEAWMLTFAATVPFLCLGLLMWLARLEDTLGDGLDNPKVAREGVAAPAAAKAEKPGSSPAAA